ncbi:Sterile alpha motif domain-containing protein 9-like [Anabarilius grahami]|uniref:Sterile alpha motif domain-containing protein 9-like n=1 Tax=Anabarilius grahami TaxID=495550 RepID=A0A3N0XTL6_ANAGA|nr:Sterile alpha motif domain-containing protein 9-like [Anabarilius grahami]
MSLASSQGSVSRLSAPVQEPSVVHLLQGSYPPFHRVLQVMFMNTSPLCLDHIICQSETPVLSSHRYISILTAIRQNKTGLIMYQLPSCSPNNTISIPTELRDSLSCLDIVWCNIFETVDSKINPDRARQYEVDFLQGAPPTWPNFDKSTNLQLVERDGFNDLIQLIEEKREKSCLITDVSLQYQPGSGGSTLAMQVLWHFRKDLRCARVIDSMNDDLDTKELSKQVVDLFLLSKEKHAEQDRKTVLLLLDTKEKTDNDLPIKNDLWENLVKEIHNRDIDTQTPVVIILNCSTADFSLNDTMILDSKVSEEEIRQFKEKLLQQIRLQRKSQWEVKTINLLYHKDSSGSAVVREVLQDLREEFTCEILTEPFTTEPFTTEIRENKDEFKREIENMANTLHGKYETHKKPVLLLLDHKDDKPLRYLLKNLQSKLQRSDRPDRPAFIIINAVKKSVVRAPGHVKLKLELLPDEKEKFAQKRQEIEKKHKKISKTFHAFNIMQGGFQKEDAEKVITEEMVNHIGKDKQSSSTRLLSFLALTNSYVPGSHLLKPLCKTFIKKKEWPTDEGKPSVEMIMKPFMDLIVIFSDGEQNCIRLKHPMIADTCLKMFTENNLTRSDIALDFLKGMVNGNESNYKQICKRMLVTRPEGLIEKEKFSRLILDIIRESKTNKCKCKCNLLERASNLFPTDPFYPQALARLYYIRVNEKEKYCKAEEWAEEAIKRDPKKSHIRDTLGQVHKNHLRSEVKKPCTNIDNMLLIAQSAIDAFKREEKAAEDELVDNTRFNNRGHFGFLQVCKEISDLKPLLISPNNHLQHKYHVFRAEVESKYDFFEWYLAFSRPSNKKDDPDYICEDVEDCYKRYFTQGEQTEEKTLNQKKMKSFGGLLHFLKSDIDVLEQNLIAIEKPQSKNETQTILYILANIILSQSDEPSEKIFDMLQKLWSTEAHGRSPEFYLLILLLFWSDESKQEKANPPNLENCVKYMSQSYERTYQKYLHGRHLVPLFFYGKGAGLQILVHSKLDKTDLDLLTDGDGSVEVKCLQRIDGKVEDHKVFAVRNGQQIPVVAHNRASVCRRGQVSFYLGFTIRGPVAYNIRYQN